MNPDPKPSLIERFQLVLRRSQQPIIGGLVALSLIGMGCYFWIQSIVHDGLVDIDQRPTSYIHFMVDINSANWPELANLPGIGETYAKSIVQYRHQHGPFRSHKELLGISGIGNGKLNKIKPYLAPILVPISPRPVSQ